MVKSNSQIIYWIPSSSTVFHNSYLLRNRRRFQPNRGQTYPNIRPVRDGWTRFAGPFHPLFSQRGIARLWKMLKTEKSLVNHGGKPFFPDLSRVSPFVRGMVFHQAFNNTNICFTAFDLAFYKALTNATQQIFLKTLSDKRLSSSSAFSPISGRIRLGFPENSTVGVRFQWFSPRIHGCFSTFSTFYE